MEFHVSPTFSYSGMGCCVIVNQKVLYQQFMGYIDIYMKNINHTVARMHHEYGYLELMGKVRE